MPIRDRKLIAAAVLLGASLLAACSSEGDASDGASSPERPAGVEVVSSLAVWGDLADVIGGDAVTVTSIIDRPAKDPHDYEATTQDQLRLSEADLVIENGGGFDEFVVRMLDAADSGTPKVLSVAELVGYQDGDNEHFWYDYPAVKQVAASIAEQLTAIDPDNQETFTENLANLNADLDAMIARVEVMRESFAGTPVGTTEPVAAYLLEAIGLEIETDPELSETLEEGSDVPPALMLETLDLYATGAVDVLVYKEQRVGPQNEQILEAAESNDVPVALVQETFELDGDYISWMNELLDELESALSR